MTDTSSQAVSLPNLSQEAVKHEKSRLMQLPDELRVMVLRQMLSPGVLHAMPSPRHELVPNILRTCQEFHDKGSEVLYKENVAKIILQPGKYENYHQWATEAPAQLPFREGEEGLFVALGDVHMQMTWYSEQGSSIIPNPRIWSEIANFKAVEILIAGPLEFLYFSDLWIFAQMARQSLLNAEVKLVFHNPEWALLNDIGPIPSFEWCIKALSLFRCRRFEFTNIPTSHPRICDIARSTARLIMSTEPFTDYYSQLWRCDTEIVSLFPKGTKSKVITYLGTMQDCLLEYDIGGFQQSLRLASLLIQRYRRRLAGRQRAKSSSPDCIARRVKEHREEERRKRREALTR